MDKKSEILQLIPEQGLLPLFFYKDADVSVEVLKALYEAGIRTVEYTNRGEAALKNFEKLREACDNELEGMYLGVGTIKDGEMAKTFIEAGADYIISPGLVKSVAKVADKNNMLWVPGCMTPTEIIRAEEAGAELIKLFPGSLLGPSYVTAVIEIFPDLKFMPTGGVEVTRENLSAWFKAGVVAVGLGSKVISQQLMQARDYATIGELTSKALALVKEIK